MSARSVLYISRNERWSRGVGGVAEKGRRQRRYEACHLLWFFVNSLPRRRRYSWSLRRLLCSALLWLLSWPVVIHSEFIRFHS